MMLNYVKFRYKFRWKIPRFQRNFRSPAAKKGLGYNTPKIFGAGGDFVFSDQEALKGDILKGDIWKWDFALKLALENGISLCSSHSTRQFSQLFLRKFHREGAV